MMITRGYVSVAAYGDERHHGCDGHAARGTFVLLPSVDSPTSASPIAAALRWRCLVPPVVPSVARCRTYCLSVPRQGRFIVDTSCRVSPFTFLSLAGVSQFMVLQTLSNPVGAILRNSLGIYRL